MKLTKKQLIERWTPEMKEALVQRWRTGVIGESPFGLTDEGRHDFRGCTAYPLVEFCNLELCNFDFSYYEFQRITFRNCKLVNWYCEKLKCALTLWDTTVTDCNFINADLTSSSFGPSVVRCNFIKCRLYDMYSDDSVFEDCLIENCKVQHMPATISYIRTKFVGPLHRFYFCQKIEFCDFTEAQFDDCEFRGGTDIGSVFSASHHVVLEPSKKAEFCKAVLLDSKTILTARQYSMAEVYFDNWSRGDSFIDVIDEEGFGYFKTPEEWLGFVYFIVDTDKKYQALNGNV